MRPEPDLLDYRGEIDFNRASAEPIYYQIGAAIADAVAARRIPAGLRLPPAPALAEGLHIAPATARNVIGYLERRQCVRRIGRRRYLAQPPAADRSAHLVSSPSG